MIRRRKVTAKNRPNTVAEAFDLYAQLSSELPTRNDPAQSVAQIRTTYIESVNQLTASFERRINVLSRQNADLKDQLNDFDDKLKNAKQLLDAMIADEPGRKPSFWSRLRFALGF